jgi:hypothetical protein
VPDGQARIAAAKLLAHQQPVAAARVTLEAEQRDALAGVRASSSASAALAGGAPSSS